MGRARGNTSAAVAPRRRRRTEHGFSSRNQEQWYSAAYRGDFDPYLAAAQAPTEQSEALLDSTTTPAVCQLAVDDARQVHAHAMNERLRRAGVNTRALHDGIISLAGHLAEHDLRFALYRLVELQADGKRALVARDASFRQHAYALLDNRLSEALSEPVDADLLNGEWRVLRGY